MWIFAFHGELKCAGWCEKWIRFLIQVSSEKKYQLRIVNKGLLIDEGKHLSDYPMTTGDLVEIEEI